MFNNYKKYPYQISQLPSSRGETDPHCHSKKKLDFKTLKKNTFTSLNDVEYFLNNFSYTLKYIRLINLLK